MVESNEEEKYVSESIPNIERAGPNGREIQNEILPRLFLGDIFAA